MNEIENKLLENLKTFPVQEEFLAEFPLPRLENACIAWSLCGVEMSNLTDYSENGMDLWNNCNYNKEKWFRLLFFIPPAGFMYKLIHSNLIYPDGDYNQSWLRERKQREINKGGREWKKK